MLTNGTSTARIKLDEKWLDLYRSAMTSSTEALRPWQNLIKELRIRGFKTMNLF